MTLTNAVKDLKKWRRVRVVQVMSKGKSIPSSRTSQCKGPVVGGSLGSIRDWKATVGGTTRLREVMEMGWRMGSSQTKQGLWAMGKMGLYP